MSARPTLIFDFDSTLVDFETLEALADIALADALALAQPLREAVQVCIGAFIAVAVLDHDGIAIAALATAEETTSIKRGSKGLGIRYSGPKASFSPA